MSYKALYRKYRPTNFNDLVGQSVVKEILKNSIINNKVGHAYIFSGPRGTGKTSSAKIFASQVNCENFKDGKVCGKCKSCLQTGNLDIIEIDAASNNGVDEIREIRNNCKLMPSVGKYKVYIIDEVHMLSIGAFNALLKTLEEPPAHVIFILATTEIHKIPLTILSRCQKFEFKKVSVDDIVLLLNRIINNEKISIDESAVKLIAELSDGGLRDSINLLDQVNTNIQDNITKEHIYDLIGVVKDTVIDEFVSYLLNANSKDCLKVINNINSEGKNIYNFLERVINSLKDMLYESDNGNIIFVIKEYIDLLGKIKNSTNQKIVVEIYTLDIINKLRDRSESLELSDDVINDDSSIESKGAKVKQSSDIVEAEVVKSKQEVNDVQKVVNESFKDSEENKTKNIRINNCFALADKGALNRLKKDIDLFNDFVSDKSYSTQALLMLDAKPIVASDKNFMFMFKEESNVNMCNTNSDKIEKLISKMLDIKVKVIAITESEWDNLKKEYKNNIKNGVKYEYIEEEKKQPQIKNASVMEKSAITLFGSDIVDIK